MFSVTCRLYVRQNDWGLLCATVLTQGLNWHWVRVSTESKLCQIKFSCQDSKTRNLLITSPAVYEQVIPADFQSPNATEEISKKLFNLLRHCLLSLTTFVLLGNLTSISQKINCSNDSDSEFLECVWDTILNAIGLISNNKERKWDCKLSRPISDWQEASVVFNIIALLTMWPWSLAIFHTFQQRILHWRKPW